MAAISAGLTSKLPLVALSTSFRSGDDGIETRSGRTRAIQSTAYVNAGRGIHCTSANHRDFIEESLIHSNGVFGNFVQVGAGATLIKNQVGGISGGTLNSIQAESTSAASIHPLANFPSR